MRKRDLGVLVLAVLEACLLSSQAADHKPTGFYFKGKEFHLGMSEREAMAELSVCCKLSPPPKPDADGAVSPPGQPKGYFIIAKEESSQSVLGAIWFKGQKVVSLSHELAENVDTSNDELVAFMRAFKRSLPDAPTMAVIGVRHEQASNGESDVLTLELPDERRIVIRILTLDKAEGPKRDFVTIEEVLGATN